MDFHSIEFYVLALFVAFALIGIIFGRTDRSPAQTFIEAMNISADDPQAPHTISLTSQPDGKVTITHRGLELNDGDTLNLIATVIDDKVKLQLKRGIVAPSGNPMPVTAVASVAFFPNERIHLRYESEFTGEWCVFTFTNREGSSRTVQLQR